MPVRNDRDGHRLMEEVELHDVFHEDAERAEIQRAADVRARAAEIYEEMEAFNRLPANEWQ